MTKSMHIALNDMKVEQLFVIYPGPHRYPAADKIMVWPIHQVQDLLKHF